MNQKSSLLDRLKKKNLLWFAGWLVLLLSIFGISYGIWICYNGILLKSTASEALLNLLENNSMSIEDGVYALVGFGTVIIIYYLFTAGLGGIGILSANRVLVRQTIFWFSIFLISLSIIFGFLGILSWRVVIANLICLGFYAITVFSKYNIDLNKVNKN